MVSSSWLQNCFSVSRSTLDEQQISYLHLYFLTLLYMQILCYLDSLTSERCGCLSNFQIHLTYKSKDIKTARFHISQFFFFTFIQIKNIYKITQSIYRWESQVYHSSDSRWATTEHRSRAQVSPHLSAQLVLFDINNVTQKFYLQQKTLSFQEPFKIQPLHLLHCHQSFLVPLLKREGSTFFHLLVIYIIQSNLYYLNIFVECISNQTRQTQVSYPNPSVKYPSWVLNKVRGVRVTQNRLLFSPIFKFVQGGKLISCLEILNNNNYIVAECLFLHLVILIVKWKELQWVY